jgi:hypothetical protein
MFAEKFLSWLLSVTLKEQTSSVESPPIAIFMFPKFAATVAAMLIGLTFQEQ